jgi:hypothetical protein
MLAICYEGMQNSMTFNINEYKKDKQQRFDPCWTTFNVERYNKNYKMLKTQFELIVVKAWHPCNTHVWFCGKVGQMLEEALFKIILWPCCNMLDEIRLLITFVFFINEVLSSNLTLVNE